MTHSVLASLIGKFPGRRIAVVGDLMLDVYVWGNAVRISPEAPVPVVQVHKRTSCLGGAANVMRNIATLGGAVYGFGVIGDDADGRELARQLESYGISSANLLVDAERHTIQKQRIIASTQQLMRIDYEETNRIGEELARKLESALCDLIRRHEIDVLIFDDYRKGVLSTDFVQRVADCAAAEKVLTLLDPKPGNLAPIRGLTVLKPNFSEALALAGMPQVYSPDPAERKRLLAAAAERLMEQWRMKYLLISLAADGMALFEHRKETRIIPTRAREVFDVSGAGDTVISALALALAAGASPAEAAELANYAAGIVVGKVGTVTVSAGELENELNI